ADQSNRAPNDLAEIRFAWRERRRLPHSCLSLGRSHAYCRTSRTGSGLSGTRSQVLASFSSKRHTCPRPDSRSNSPWSIRQEVGPNRVTRGAQPGLSLSIRPSALAALFASVSVQIG